MCYARAITVAAADLYGPAAKTALVLQYGLLHYLVTCPQTGIPHLPVCKMTAFKMILLHSLIFKEIPVQNMFNFMCSYKVASIYQMN
jgi:hypothetical protein